MVDGRRTKIGLEIALPFLQRGGGSAICRLCRSISYQRKSSISVFLWPVSSNLTIRPKSSPPQACHTSARSASDRLRVRGESGARAERPMVVFSSTYWRSMAPSVEPGQRRLGAVGAHGLQLHGIEYLHDIAALNDVADCFGFAGL